MKILVTGAAGFIGAALSQQLLERGDQVVGIDNMNDYYDVSLKEARLALLMPYNHFSFVTMDIADRDAMNALFADQGFDAVINLAAQAGVRYSIINPAAYIDANLTGFANILEGCRQHKVNNVVFASSSSVYGANERYPFNEDHAVDHPVSLYAATKKSNELMAHAYASLYDMSVTGLRFFTVYGPWGRPDMALFIFTKKILNNEPIDVFNDGNMFRDFTYIDDIVSGIIAVIDKPAAANSDWQAADPQPSSSYCDYRIYNIGNDSPIQLLYFIERLENALGKKAIKNFLPMQDGDVQGTAANIEKLYKHSGFKPKISVEEGIEQFVQWYRGYY